MSGRAQAGWRWARRSTISVGLSLTVAVSIVLLAIEPVGAVSAPRIIKASMLDSNRDGHADEVVLTYSVAVNHALDTSGSYPFVVQGYAITSVGAAAASTTLVINLAQRLVSDVTVTPFVIYSG